MIRVDKLLRKFTQSVYKCFSKNRIIFFVHGKDTLNGIETIYNCLRGRIEVYFVAIEDGSEQLLKACKMVNPKSIPYKKEGKIINLLRLRPRYIFYTTPYDNHVPPQYRIKKVSFYAKTCYTVYGVATATNESSVYNGDFFQYLNFFFAPNFHVYNTVNDKINSVYGKNVLTGYTKLDGLSEWKTDEEHPFSAIWNPRWLVHVKQKSNFFKYKDLFLEYYMQNTEDKFIFRPHPMAFNHYIQKHFISKQELEEYCESFENNRKLDTDWRYYETFWKSDVLISDVSSLLVEYFYTGKPIIFCPGEEKLNELGMELSKGFYIANSFDEIVKYLEMLKSGKDELKETRKEIIKKLYIEENASKKIAEVLLKTRFC